MIKKVIKSISNKIRMRVLKSKGISFGKKTLIGAKYSIISGKNIHLKNNVNIGIHSRLCCYPNRGKKMMDNCELCISDNVRIGRNCTILCSERVKIDENCLIASYVFITDFNHGCDPREIFDHQELISKSVYIRKNVWIGEKVIILPGVTIGDNSIIGAGSVVTKDIPAYSIAVGNPAKVIKKWSFDDERWINI